MRLLLEPVDNRLDPAEPGVDALPAGRDEVDEQRQIVDPRVPVGERIVLEPFQAADDLVRQPAKLGEVATHRLGGSSRQNELALMIESYLSMYRFYATYYPRSWTTAARGITRAAMLARSLALVFRRGRRRARLAAYREIARL